MLTSIQDRTSVVAQHAASVPASQPASRPAGSPCGPWSIMNPIEAHASEYLLYFLLLRILCYLLFVIISDSTVLSWGYSFQGVAPAWNRRISTPDSRDWVCIRMAME